MRHPSGKAPRAVNTWAILVLAAALVVVGVVTQWSAVRSRFIAELPSSLNWPLVDVNTVTPRHEKGTDISGLPSLRSMAFVFNVSVAVPRQLLVFNSAVACRRGGREGDHSRRDRNGRSPPATGFADEDHAIFQLAPEEGGSAAAEVTLAFRSPACRAPLDETAAVEGFVARHCGDRVSRALRTLRSAFMRQQVLQYCALFAFGGVLLDASRFQHTSASLPSTRVVSVPEPPSNRCAAIFVTAPRSPGLATRVPTADTGFMAATRRHPLVRHVLDLIADRVERRSYGGGDPSSVTGDDMLSRVLLACYSESPAPAHCCSGELTLLSRPITIFEDDTIGERGQVVDPGRPGAPPLFALRDLTFDGRQEDDIVAADCDAQPPLGLSTGDDDAVLAWRWSQYRLQSEVAFYDRSWYTVGAVENEDDHASENASSVDWRNLSVPFDPLPNRSPFECRRRQSVYSAELSNFTGLWNWKGDAIPVSIPPRTPHGLSPVNLSCVDTASGAWRAIPRLVMQTHRSERFESAGMELATKRLVGMNPSYTYRYYSNAAAEAFMAAHCGARVVRAFHAIRPGAFKGDLARYCLLYVLGGVYFDMDLDIRRPLETILRPGDRWLSAEDNGGKGVYNAFMAVTPRHPMTRAVMLEALRRIEARYYVPNMVLGVTGPRMMGEVFAERLRLDPAEFDVLAGAANHGLISRPGSVANSSNSSCAPPVELVGVLCRLLRNTTALGLLAADFGTVDGKPHPNASIAVRRLLAGGYRLMRHLHDYTRCPYGSIADPRRPRLGVLVYNRYPGAWNDKVGAGTLTYEHMYRTRRIYADDPPPDDRIAVEPQQGGPKSPVSWFIKNVLNR